MTIAPNIADSVIPTVEYTTSDRKEIDNNEVRIISELIKKNQISSSDELIYDITMRMLNYLVSEFSEAKLENTNIYRLANQCIDSIQISPKNNRNISYIKGRGYNYYLKPDQSYDSRSLPKFMLDVMSIVVKYIKESPEDRLRCNLTNLLNEVNPNGLDTRTQDKNEFGRRIPTPSAPPMDNNECLIAEPLNVDMPDVLPSTLSSSINNDFKPDISRENIVRASVISSEQEKLNLRQLLEIENLRIKAMKEAFNWELLRVSLGVRSCCVKNTNEVNQLIFSAIYKQVLRYELLESQIQALEKSGSHKNVRSMLYLIESQLSKAKDSYQEINKIKGDIIPKVDQIAEIPVVIASSNPNLEVEDDIQKALIVEDNTENISKINLQNIEIMRLQELMKVYDWNEFYDSLSSPNCLKRNFSKKDQSKLRNIFVQLKRIEIYQQSIDQDSDENEEFELSKFLVYVQTQLSQSMLERIRTIYDVNHLIIPLINYLESKGISIV